MSAPAPTPPPPAADETSPTVRRLGFFLGLALFALTFFVSPPDGLSLAGWRVCGLALWMATWWITEAVPLPVTALLPLTVLPLGGLMPLKKAAANFAADLIFLFLGGFILSIALQKWRVHERLGFGLLCHVGASAPRLLGGLILVTGLLGMWMSNAATAMVMMPMALSIATLVRHDHSSPLTKALVLGVAYAPCLGGLGTFIGAPTNAVLNAYLSKTYGVQISLAEWMSFGVPLALVLLTACWALLNFTLLRHTGDLPDLGEAMRREYARLGRFTVGEIATTSVFLLCVVAWVFREFWSGVFGVEFEDAVIAIAGALALFLIPVDRRLERTVLNWKDTEKLPWGILLFFGGSLSLSAALTETGVTRWLSTELDILAQVPPWLAILAVIALVIALSEMMSNSATVLAVLPILTALAGGLGLHPLLLMVPATLGASCAFMLPGASPTNAIAYATGVPKVPEMVRIGVILNLVSAALLLLASLYLVPAALNFNPHEPPPWATPPAAR